MWNMQDNGNNMCDLSVPVLFLFTSFSTVAIWTDARHFQVVHFQRCKAELCAACVQCWIRSQQY